MSKLKITTVQALALLSAAGAPPVEIVADEKDASTEFSADAALASIDEARTAVIRPKIEGEIRTEVSKAAAGKSAGTIRSIVKRKFGLKEADLEGLNEEQMIEKGLTTRDEKLSKDTEELRKEITDLTEKHAGELSKKEDEWKGKVKDAEDRYTERDIDEYLAAQVKGVPRTGGNELAQARQLKAHLRDTYNIVWNAEKKAVELREKANPEKLAMNAVGNQLLALGDVTRTFLTDLGVAATDQRHVNPKDAMNNDRGGAADDSRQRSSSAVVSDDVKAHLDALEA